MVLFLPITSSAQFQFSHFPLIDAPRYSVTSIHAFDNDNDGDIDFLLGQFPGNLYLYENIDDFFYIHYISSSEMDYRYYYMIDKSEPSDETFSNFIYTIGQTDYYNVFEGVYSVIVNDGNNLLREIPLGIVNEAPMFFMDMDADEDEDIVYLSSENNSIYYIRNTDNFATLSYNVLLNRDNFNISSNDVFPLDIDSDGDEDIVCYCNNRNCFVAIENNAGFFESIILLTDPILEDYQTNILLHENMDLDYDGDMDCVVETKSHVEGEVYISKIWWLENVGGTLQPNEIFSIENEDGIYWDSKFFTFADFDDDGDCDIASSWRRISDAEYIIYENVNNEDFDIVDGPYAENPCEFGQAVDLDGDSDKDLLYLVEGHGRTWYHYNLWMAENGITLSARELSFISKDYEITKAYPNPFNPTLNVQVSLPETSVLRLTVHNVLGQEVAVMSDQNLNAGQHTFTFNGSDLSSGIYFVKAVVEGKMNDVQKVVLMK